MLTKSTAERLLFPLVFELCSDVKLFEVRKVRTQDTESSFKLKTSKRVTLESLSTLGGAVLEVGSSTTLRS